MKKFLNISDNSAFRITCGEVYHTPIQPECPSNGPISRDGCGNPPNIGPQVKFKIFPTI